MRRSGFSVEIDEAGPELFDHLESQDPDRPPKVNTSAPCWPTFQRTTMSPGGLKLPAPVGKAVKRLSTFLGTKLQLPNHAPPIGPSRFSSVPIDITEEILLNLPDQDILRMKQVR